MTSQVQFDDEYEKLDGTHQRYWNTLMDKSQYKSPSFYRSVKCLLISWGPQDDDLHTAKEVADLASVWRDTFNFKVETKVINIDPQGLRAQLQVSHCVSNFLVAEHGPGTLLIFYYAGHGSPKSSDGRSNGLHLNGKRTHDDPNFLNEVAWGPIEHDFQYANTDVLEIFDCCYAGDLGRAQQSWGTRSSEFLGACAGGVTRSPGKESFTTALIWALEALAKQQTKFTIFELWRTIQEAPDFPRDQNPVLLNRCGNALQHIVLAPLTETKDCSEVVQIEPDDTGRQGILTLNFVFQEPPSQYTITQIAHSLDRVKSDELHRIVWGGLNSWGGGQRSAGVQSGVIKAAQRFREGSNRRKSRGKEDRIAVPSLGVNTPSSAEDISRHSTPGTPPRAQKGIKRSTE